VSDILPALDLEKALDAASNKRFLADDLLEMFIKAIPDYRQDIKNNHNNKNELKLIIHKIYGALQYLGTPELADIIAKMNEDLFNLTEEELGHEIEHIFTAFDKILKEGSYS